MGGGESSLNICTLNYSGIALSPFEFYGKNNWRELEEICKLYEKYVIEYYQEFLEEVKTEER